MKLTVFHPYSSHVTRQTQFEHPLAARYGQHYLTAQGAQLMAGGNQCPPLNLSAAASSSNSQSNSASSYSSAMQLLQQTSPFLQPHPVYHSPPLPPQTQQPIYANANNASSNLGNNSESESSSSVNLANIKSSTDQLLASLMEQHRLSPAANQQSSNQESNTDNHVIYSNLPHSMTSSSQQITGNSSLQGTKYSLANGKSSIITIGGNNPTTASAASKIIINTANPLKPDTRITNLNIDAAILSLQNKGSVLDGSSANSSSSSLNNNGSSGQLSGATSQRPLPSLPLPPRPSRTSSNIVPANPYLTEEIPNWLIIYSKAPPEHDHKLDVSFVSIINFELN